MSAEILPTDSEERFAAAVRRAADLLRGGQLVAIPTETVYGLAANALDVRAIQRLFHVKGRPARNPIIVHVAGPAMARECVTQWPELAEKLARSFWPGPLTLVLPRSASIPGLVTAGGPTVGVRWPSHPFAQAVIRRCGFPLAAPSANLSGRVSPTCAAHVRSQLGDTIPLIIDGGPCPVGIESTVLDLSSDPPRLLRPGMIHEDVLLGFTRKLALGQGAEAVVLKSPGLLRKHYAPRARLVVWAWQHERELRARAQQCGLPAHRLFVVAHTRIPSAEGFGRVAVIPHDPEAFARALYAELHHCDDAGAELIIVEAVPAEGDWRAVADRLSRAAAT